jgi:hypothetical protein
MRSTGNQGLATPGLREAGSTAQWQHGGPDNKLRSTPHKEGLGFSIELKAFPIDGRLVVLPPDIPTTAPVATASSLKHLPFRGLSRPLLFVSNPIMQTTLHVAPHK